MTARPYTTLERAGIKLLRAMDCEDAFAADIYVQYAVSTLRDAGYHVLADRVLQAHWTEWQDLSDELMSAGRRRGAEEQQEAA